MPTFETRNLGRIAYDTGSEIEFPRGLPGFEQRRRFVAAQTPESQPLVFLQSLEDPGLCFITAPVGAVAPGYRLELEAEDRELLRLPAGRGPETGGEALCLAVIAVRESGPTANLLAPIVVNLRNRLAVQAVNQLPGHSHQHRLELEEAAVCS